MRTTKPTLLLALAILAMPSAVMADLIGPNTSIVKAYSVTSFNQAEGYWIRNEKYDTANSGQVTIDTSSNNPAVIVTADNEKRTIILPTLEKAQALKDILTHSSGSVRLTFHVEDCKAGNCSSVKGNVYGPENMEIAINQVSQPLSDFLAEVRPTNEEKIAKQLKELGQRVESTANNVRIHTGNLVKELEPTPAQAQAIDYATVYVGGAK